MFICFINYYGYITLFIDSSLIPLKMNSSNNNNQYSNTFSNTYSNNNTYCDNPFAMLKIIASSSSQTNGSSSDKSTIYSYSDRGCSFESDGIRSMSSQGYYW